ncbi:hypothetical protein ACPV3A_09795 [Paenibacillus sp. Dod16]|uniref:hypothetical protein n=1 Tax=unclassified Paenibacillus TaxID=185978 RepID=UPI00188D7877|nr:hypothetical protein [Paenibacillus sp. JZ16]
MNKYRISKYNPIFRGSTGRYSKEDWTAISDIGKTFDGQLLTVELYKSVEDNYVNTVRTIMNYLNVSHLTVSNIRKGSNEEEFEKVVTKYQPLYNNNEIRDAYYNLVDNTKLSAQEIGPVVRLLLREDIGADVYCENVMRVFIGYDYLMGIHTAQPIESIVLDIERMGVFVEKV